jgi:hypothetical protein
MGWCRCGDPHCDYAPVRINSRLAKESDEAARYFGRQPVTAPPFLVPRIPPKRARMTREQREFLKSQYSPVNLPNIA